MSAFCQGLKGMNPEIDLYENFGKVFLPAILPQDSGNPFRDKNFEQTPAKIPETWRQFIDRTIDTRGILGRVFKNVDNAVKPEKQWDFLSYLWFFAQGMNSLDTDLDFNDLFTDEELIDLWKIDNFQFYTLPPTPSSRRCSTTSSPSTPRPASRWKPSTSAATRCRTAPGKVLLPARR